MILSYYHCSELFCTLGENVSSTPFSTYIHLHTFYALIGKQCRKDGGDNGGMFTGNSQPSVAVNGELAFFAGESRFHVHPFCNPTSQRNGLGIFTQWQAFSWTRKKKIDSYFYKKKRNIKKCRWRTAKPDTYIQIKVTSILMV